MYIYCPGKKEIRGTLENDEADFQFALICYFRCSHGQSFLGADMAKLYRRERRFPFIELKPRMLSSGNRVFSYWESRSIYVTQSS